MTAAMKAAATATTEAAAGRGERNADTVAALALDLDLDLDLIADAVAVGRYMMMVGRVCYVLSRRNGGGCKCEAMWSDLGGRILQNAQR